MSGTLKPPKELGPAGRSLYRDVLADVAANWELDSKDHHNLDAACRAVDRVTELERLIAQDGLIVDGKVNPLVVESRLQVQQAVYLLGKVETSPPKAKTGHLNSRQRLELRRLNGAVG
jgi:phage terminase small subunit